MVCKCSKVIIYYRLYSTGLCYVDLRLSELWHWEHLQNNGKHFHMPWIRYSFFYVVQPRNKVIWFLQGSIAAKTSTGILFPCCYCLKYRVCHRQNPHTSDLRYMIYASNRYFTSFSSRLIYKQMNSNCNLEDGFFRYSSYKDLLVVPRDLSHLMYSGICSEDTYSCKNPC